MTNKNRKDEINKEVIEMSASAGNFIDNFLGDVSKKSATKQILIGAGSGWLVSEIINNFSINIRFLGPLAS